MGENMIKIEAETKDTTNLTMKEMERRDSNNLHKVIILELYTTILF